VKCAHCVVANSTSHKAQQILGRLASDEPFDIVSYDIWVPGITDPQGTGPSRLYDKVGKTRRGEAPIKQAAITGACNLTGFATAAFLSTMDSKTIANQVFAHHIIPNGLPRMVLIDNDSLFKRGLIDVLDQLQINYHVVAPEQHEAIVGERFHRFLKVLRMQGLDTKDHSQWMMNVLLTTYAWNASPIEGTSMERSIEVETLTGSAPVGVASLTGSSPVVVGTSVAAGSDVGS
jgi:hypothetical protein